MANIPRASKPKELPADEQKQIELPFMLPLKEETPAATPEKNTKPEASKPLDFTPDPSAPKTELPQDIPPENCVVIDGKTIENKPTKFKYFRNKGASAYGIIKQVPIHELLVYDKGVFDPNRSADQLLYDFLIAVFDDPIFVREHYDDLDPEILEQILKIFGRINHIDEKEEAVRKNKEAQMKH